MALLFVVSILTTAIAISPLNLHIKIALTGLLSGICMLEILKHLIGV